MATRKQRRRRSKELRHEYVWEDGEGNELDPNEVPTRKAQPGQARPQSSRRTPQPPSWRRTLRRGLIFAPIMFVTVMLLAKNLTLAQQITQTLIVVAVFIPFSYLIEGVIYRRTTRHNQADGRRGS
jgi:hypothetical protein